MLILAIETSCDETAAAVLKDNKKLLSSVLFSQDKIHAEYGGIVPEVAARKHIEIIIPIIDKALKDAKTNLSKIDVIATTSGPGLITSLMVGIDTAKTFSYALKKPLVSVNHMEGHIYSNFIPVKSKEVEIDFPALCLITSGGHTELVLMKDHGRYKEIGSTRDDAAGEAFDKVAKLLNIGYPGGPVISRMANLGNAKAYSFPRPMMNEKNFDFSFSGLKTDVLRLVNKKKGKFSRQEINNICASFQMAVVDVLTHKALKAAKKYRAKSIMLAGGVSANKLLRRKMETMIRKEIPEVKFHAPNLKYCTDNAAMIAQAAYYHAIKKDFTPYEKVKVNPNLEL